MWSPAQVQIRSVWLGTGYNDLVLGGMVETGGATRRQATKERLSVLVSDRSN